MLPFKDKNDDLSGAFTNPLSLMRDEVRLKSYIKVFCQFNNNFSVKEQNSYSVISIMVFVMVWKDGLKLIFLKTVNIFVVSESAQTIITKTLPTITLVKGPVNLIV